jgi:hypothetical protein
MDKSKPDRPPNGLKKLFSTPSLMNGEDGAIYADLCADLEELVQPRNVWDQMRVSDVANRYWEQQRYRRATGAVINGKRREALVTIVNDGIGLSPRDARAAADIYFRLARIRPGSVLSSSELGAVNLPGNRAGVVGLLRRHGFTEADIDHVAMQMSVDTLAGLENLALKHETRREAILTDLMRRREGRGLNERPAEHSDLNGTAVALAKQVADRRPYK